MGGSKVSWDKVIWARASIPRHAFIAWVCVHRRLPTKVRLSKLYHQNDLQCVLCSHHNEDDSHLFTACPYAREVWDAVMHWWPLPFRNTFPSLETMAASLSRFKAPRTHKQISYAIFAATLYFIWYVRNQLLFRNHLIVAQSTVCMIKEQIRHRVLFLNNLSCKYTTLVDVVLQ